MYSSKKLYKLGFLSLTSSEITILLKYFFIFMVSVFLNCNTHGFRVFAARKIFHLIPILFSGFNITVIIFCFCHFTGNLLKAFTVIGFIKLIFVKRFVPLVKNSSAYNIHIPFINRSVAVFVICGDNGIIGCFIIF